MTVKKFWKVYLDDVDSLKYWHYPRDYNYKEIFTFKNDNFKRQMDGKDYFFISFKSNPREWGWMPGGHMSYEFYIKRDYKYFGEAIRFLKLERLKNKING